MNAAGETQKDYALVVLVPPEISILPRSKRLAIIENETLLLDCPASGHPEPKITWTKDGVGLTENNIDSIIPGGSFIAASAIQIMRIQRDTGTGVYTCEARNSAGYAYTDIAVDVMSRSI